MGMFDYVRFECPCPDCGHMITNFQSKDGPCRLLSIKPNHVDNFYSSCDNCGAWLDFTRRWRKKKFLRSVWVFVDGKKKEINDEYNRKFTKREIKKLMVAKR